VLLKYFNTVAKMDETQCGLTAALTSVLKAASPCCRSTMPALSALPALAWKYAKSKLNHQTSFLDQIEYRRFATQRYSQIWTALALKG
jgi:hypothetical protein